MLLMVDEGRSEMQTILEELRYAGFEVEWKTDIDAALEFFVLNRRNIDLLILDVMMPPGRAFRDEDTQDGLRTGLFFYDRIRAMEPELPVVILTNFPDERAMQKYRGANCEVFRKIDLFPHELAEEIDRILKGRA